MINCYAIEPEAINSFSDLTSTVDLMEYITARRLFVYPAYKWFSDVYEKCSDHKNDTMVTEYLNNFLKFSIKSSLDYDEDKEWIINAEQQIQSLNELKAIINLNKSGKIYVKLSECNSMHPLLNVQHSFNIARTPSAIVDNFDILLKYANRIVFVDRFFDVTNACCTNIVDEIKSRVLRYNRQGKLNFAFCISKEKYNEKIILARKQKFFDYYFKKLRSDLTNVIDVYLVEEKYFHNRFVLSEIASWQGGNGFSDNSNSGGVDNDDFTPMDYGHYQKMVSYLTQDHCSYHFEFKLE